MRLPNVLINIIEEYTREYSFLEQYKNIITYYNPDKFTGENNLCKIFSFYYWNIILNNEYRTEWTNFLGPNNHVRYYETDEFGTFKRDLKYTLERKKRKWRIMYK